MVRSPQPLPSRNPVALPLLPQCLAADAQEVGGAPLVAAGVGQRVADLLLLHLDERPGTAAGEIRGRRWIDRSLASQDRAALEDVAELPEVSRPRVLQDPFAGRRRQGETRPGQAVAQVR